MHVYFINISLLSACIYMCMYIVYVCTCRLRTQEETAKQLESEKREISDAAQNLQANLEVRILYTCSLCNTGFTR